MPNDISQDPYDALLAWLRRSRRSKVSLRHLADLMGKTKSAVARAESGARPLGLTEFIDICIVLELDPSEEFGKLYEALKKQSEN